MAVVDNFKVLHAEQILVHYQSRVYALLEHIRFDVSWVYFYTTLCESMSTYLIYYKQLEILSVSRWELTLSIYCDASLFNIFVLCSHFHCEGLFAESQWASWQQQWREERKRTFRYADIFKSVMDQPPKFRDDLFNCILRQHNSRDAIVNAFESQ